MECQLKNITLNYEVRGTGTPVLMIHGFSVDHRLMMGCMEPTFAGREGYQRIYLDLPGMGRTKGEAWIEGSDDMLQVVLDFIDAVIPNQRFLLAGQSYGGYLARGVLKEKFEWVDGLLLICPVIFPEAEDRDVPELTVFVRDEELLAVLPPMVRDEFMSGSVVQDRYNWERVRTEVAAGVFLSDADFLAKIKGSYGFSYDVDALTPVFEKPSLFIVGRQDNTVGYRDAWKLMDKFTRASYSVLDRAGHNLQIEQAHLLDAHVGEWLSRVEEATK